MMRPSSLSPTRRASAPWASHRPAAWERVRGGSQHDKDLKTRQSLQTKAALGQLSTSAASVGRYTGLCAQHVSETSISKGLSGFDAAKLARLPDVGEEVDSVMKSVFKATYLQNCQLSNMPATSTEQRVEKAQLLNMHFWKSAGFDTIFHHYLHANDMPVNYFGLSDTLLQQMWSEKATEQQNLRAMGRRSGPDKYTRYHCPYIFFTAPPMKREEGEAQMQAYEDAAIYLIGLAPTVHCLFEEALAWLNSDKEGAWWEKAYMNDILQLTKHAICEKVVPELKLIWADARDKMGNRQIGLHGTPPSLEALEAAVAQGPRQQAPPMAADRPQPPVAAPGGNAGGQQRQGRSRSRDSCGDGARHGPKGRSRSSHSSGDKGRSRSRSRDRDSGSNKGRPTHKDSSRSSSTDSGSDGDRPTVAAGRKLQPLGGSGSRSQGATAQGTDDGSRGKPSAEAGRKLQPQGGSGSRPQGAAVQGAVVQGADGGSRDKPLAEAAQKLQPQGGSGSRPMGAAVQGTSGGSRDKPSTEAAQKLQPQGGSAAAQGAGGGRRDKPSAEAAQKLQPQGGRGSRPQGATAQGADGGSRDKPSEAGRKPQPQGGSGSRLKDAAVQGADRGSDRARPSGENGRSRSRDRGSDRAYPGSWDRGSSRDRGRDKARPSNCDGNRGHPAGRGSTSGGSERSASKDRKAKAAKEAYQAMAARDVPRLADEQRKAQLERQHRDRLQKRDRDRNAAGMQAAEKKINDFRKQLEEKEREFEAAKIMNRDLPVTGDHYAPPSADYRWRPVVDKEEGHKGDDEDWQRVGKTPFLFKGLDGKEYGGSGGQHDRIPCHLRKDGSRKPGGIESRRRNRAKFVKRKEAEQAAAEQEEAELDRQAWHDDEESDGSDSAGAADRRGDKEYQEEKRRKQDKKGGGPKRGSP